MTEDARAFSTAEVLRLTKGFNEAAADMRGGWQPSLPLELAVAQAFEAPERPASASAPSSGAGAPSRPAKDASGSKPAAAAHQTAEADQTSAGQGAAPAISLNEVVRSWKDVRAVIRPINASLEALLNSCKPMDVRGNVLVLGFPPGPLQEKMNKPENLEATRRALHDVLGVDLDVQCAVTNAKGKLPPNISQDGMVAAALNHGGKIVDMDE
jgi:hypothetical protein